MGDPDSEPVHPVWDQAGAPRKGIFPDLISERIQASPPVCAAHAFQVQLTMASRALWGNRGVEC